MELQKQMGHAHLKETAGKQKKKKCKKIFLKIRLLWLDPYPNKRDCKKVLKMQCEHLPSKQAPQSIALHLSEFLHYIQGKGTHILWQNQSPPF